jgi:hypothetical protein
MVLKTQGIQKSDKMCYHKPYKFKKKKYEIIQLKKQFIKIFNFPSFLKKVEKSKKSTRENILSKFLSKTIEIFWYKTN